jgi:tetratricopeptide (TPR) repeat protein
MVHRGVLVGLVAIAFGTGGIAAGVELQQREAIAAAEILATQAEKLETLSDLNSLTTAADSLKAAINRLEQAPKFPGQSELNALPPLRSRLATVEQKREPEQKAQEFFDTAQKHAMSAAVLVQNPPHPLQVWLAAEQKWLEAIAALKQISPSSAKFTEAQTKLKGYENNLAVVRQYVARSQQAVTLNQKAMKQIETGDHPGAIATLNQAIKLNPAFLEAILHRGLAYSYTNSHQSAMANYNMAIQLNPTSADAYYFRGAANQKMGNYQPALFDYNQVINLDANRAIAYLDRGLIYDELDQPEKALTDFDQAAKLLENNDPVTHLMVSKKAQEIRQSLPESQLSQAVVNSQTSEEIISEDTENYAEDEYDDDDDDDRRKKLRIPPNPIIIYHTETKTETKTETNKPPAKINRPRSSVVRTSRSKR